MKQSFLVALLIGILSACQPADTPTDPTPLPDSEAVITGVVPGWTLGQRDAQIIELAKGGDSVVVAKGTVTSAGRVTVSLPNPVPDSLTSPLVPGGCQGNVTTTAPSVNTLLVNELLISQEDRLLGLVNLWAGAPSDNVLGQHLYVKVYADRSTTVNGTVRCTDLSTVYENLVLKQGWNSVTIQPNEAQQSLTLRNTSVAPNLRFAAAPDGAVGYTVEDIILNLGDSVVLPVLVFPTGQYSGPVNVSLEGVPGVTASGSVNIAPLSLQRLQNLRPLSVRGSVTLTTTTQAKPGTYQGRVVFTAGKTTDYAPIQVTINSPFSLSVDKIPSEVNQGTSGTLEVSVPGLPEGTILNLPVKLVGAPSGMTVTPAVAQFSDKSPTTLLKVNVGPTVTPGMYDVRLGFQWNGYSLETMPFTIEVPEPDVRVQVQQGGKFTPGSRVRFTVTLSPEGNYTGPVTVTAQVVGTTPYYTFDRVPTTVSLNGTDPLQVTFDVVVAANAPHGTVDGLLPGFDVLVTFAGKTIRENIPFVIVE